MDFTFDRDETGVRLTLLTNDSPCAQHSLLVDRERAVAVATFLRDDPQLRLDYASNVTGVDWPERVERSKVKVKRSFVTFPTISERMGCTNSDIQKVNVKSRSWKTQLTSSFPCT